MGMTAVRSPDASMLDASVTTMIGIDAVEKAIRESVAAEFSRRMMEQETIITRLRDRVVSKDKEMDAERRMWKRRERELLERLRASGA